MSANEIVWVMGARLAFADGIFTKKSIAGDANSTPRFNCGLIIPGSDPQVKAIQKIERDLALGYDWKGGASAGDVFEMLTKKDRLALHDGDDKTKFEGFAGAMYLSPSADTRPTTIDRDRSPLTAADGRLYSGCYVNAKVEIWVQDNKWGQRINAKLLGVQFVKDGDAFGSGAPPANPDDFPDLDAGDGDGDDIYG